MNANTKLLTVAKIDTNDLAISKFMSGRKECPECFSFNPRHEPVPIRPHSLPQTTILPVTASIVIQEEPLINGFVPFAMAIFHSVPWIPTSPFAKLYLLQLLTLCVHEWFSSYVRLIIHERFASLETEDWPTDQETEDNSPYTSLKSHWVHR